MKRREFLSSIGAAALSTGVFPIVKIVQGGERKLFQCPLPRRPFGKAGDQLSVIGFSGIMARKYEQDYVNQLVRESYERGVNLFEVAPSYGNSEEKLGIALESIRKDVFIATKSKKRHKDGVLKEFQTSLKNLRTDYFDLYQLHCLITKDDVEQAFGPGGAVEAMEKLKNDGDVRYVGFSAHTVEAAMAALKYYDFDSILFPINFAMWYRERFGEQVVNYAKSKGVSVLTMKSLCRSKITPEVKKIYKNWWYRPIDDPEEASLALRFTLSLPVTSVMPPGVGGDSYYKLALDTAPSFIPLTEDEKTYLKQWSSKIDPLFSYPSIEFNLVEKGDS